MNIDIKKNNNINLLKPVALKTILGYNYYDFNEIILFRAARNSSFVYILNQDRPIKILYSLHNIERLFRTNMFYRCHKSYIINLKYIQKFFISDKKIEMISGIVIPVSKSKAKELIEISKAHF